LLLWRAQPPEKLLCRRLKFRQYHRLKLELFPAVQTHTENITTAYIAEVIKRYNGGKPTHVFLAGGIFANVKLNQRVLDTVGVKSIYIFPNMGDGGINFGALLSMAFRKGLLKERIIFDNVYFGRKYDDVAIEEALKAEQRLEKILISLDSKEQDFEEIKKAAKKNNVPVQMVPVQKLNTICRKAHQGVIAYLSIINYYEIEDVLIKNIFSF
jgi:predicted NodU family carbamoyl transferase